MLNKLGFDPPCAHIVTNSLLGEAAISDNNLSRYEILWCGLISFYNINSLGNFKMKLSISLVHSDARKTTLFKIKLLEDEILKSSDDDKLSFLKCDGAVRTCPS